MIAQDITLYGRDLPQPVSLKDLLIQIIADANPYWIRLLYAYPTGIDTQLLEFIAGQPTICKYLDIPIQHINPRILRLMNRTGLPEQILKLIELIRTMIPEMVLRTTFIVGFPSESDREFQELLDFVARGYFQHVGVFTYSCEEDTAAFVLKSKIKEPVKKMRRRQLLDVQRQVSARFLASLIGKQFEILIDKLLPDGTMVGRTGFLAPEADGIVYGNNFLEQPGQFSQGMITKSDAYNLWAEACARTHGRV